MLRICTTAMLGLFVVLFAVQSDAADSSVPTDFATIQAAIDDAGTVAGDTITVEAGTHTESSVHITKAVTIAGAGIDVSIVESGTAGVGVILYPDVDGITIRDLTIRDSSQAIRFSVTTVPISDTTLERVKFSGNASRGIEVHNSTTVVNLDVTDCEFSATGTGLRVSSSGTLENVTFEGCDFSDNGIDIYEANDGGTSTLTGLTVRDCTFTGSTSVAAIFLEEVQDALIEDCTFDSNVRDIQIFKWYQASVPVSNVTIRNNTMTDTINAVFAIFNAEHTSGQTTFDGVFFHNNTINADPVRVIYAGGHSASTGDGGLGWDTVQIRCNTFLGADGSSVPDVDFLVDYFDPTAVDSETLGGTQVLDCRGNWWGTTSEATVEADVELTSITLISPLLSADPAGSCDPILDPDPSDEGACEGELVTFSAGAVGLGDLSFEWQCDNGVSDLLGDWISGDTRDDGVVEFVDGPAAPIRGPGSLHLTTTSSSSDKATLDLDLSLGAVSDFAACFDWYRTGSTAAAVGPALKLGIDTPEDNPTGTTAEERGEDRFDKILVYEMYLNPLGRVLETDCWVDECVDQTTGLWWLVDLTTGGAGVLIGGPYQTLTDWLADTTATATSDVGTVLSDPTTEIVSLQLGVGSGNPSSDVNVGGIDYTVTDGSFSANFNSEKWVPPIVPEKNLVTDIGPNFGVYEVARTWTDFGTAAGGITSIVDLTGEGGDLETEQPRPVGAAKLETGSSTADKAELGVGDLYGTPADIFATLKIRYSWYKESVGATTPAPSLKITVLNPVCDDPTSSGDCFGTLVYEPSWNGPTSTSTTPVSSTPTTDEWVTVNIDDDNGLFWWTGGFGEPSGAGGPPLKTLAEWGTTLNSDFDDALVLVVSVGVGTFNTDQVGYFDDVEISHSFGDGYRECYDFEAIPTPDPTELTVGPVDFDDDGISYRVIVSDTFGASTTSAEALLSVTLPTIDTEPTDSDTCEGDDAIFTVVASGAGVLTYDWEESTDSGSSWSSTGETTDTLTVSAVAAADDGTLYRVTVTDENGCFVTSASALLTVLTPPTITLDLIAQEVCEGEDVTFEVAGSGAGTLSYSWSFDDGSGPVTLSETSSVLELTAVTAADDGTYTATVTDGANGCTATSSAALTVLLAPSISSQPADTTVCDGDDAIFSVTADGAGLTYDWQVSTDGGTTFTPTGETSDTLTVSAAGLGDSGNQYQVVIVGTCGSALSGTATLTVNALPVVTADPVDTSVCVTTDAMFSVTATGAATLTYDWEVSTDAGATYSSTGETGDTLTLTAVASGDNGNLYRAVVTDGNSCQATSASAELTVLEPPVITTQPAFAADPCLGDDTSLEVVATGAGLAFDWEVSTDGGSTFNTTGETATILMLTSVQLSDSGNVYRVVITGTCGTETSDEVTLTVLAPPSVVSAPAFDVDPCPGDDATVSVTADGAGLAYDWEVSTDGGSTFNSTGGTASALTLVGVTLANDGDQYRCVITGTCGTLTTGVAILDVLEPPAIVTQPSIAEDPCPDDDLVLTVAATGAGLTYDWESSTDGGTTFASTGETSDTLTVLSIDLVSGTQYRVVVSGTCAPSVTSDTVTLTVRSVPTIDVDPVSLTVCEDADATFEVTASGSPTLVYEWFVDSGSGFTAITGSDSASLTLTAVTAGMDGNLYHVVVTNDCGSATSADVSLTVRVAPSIDTEVADQADCDGGSVTFEVEASGDGTLSFEWQCDIATTDLTGDWISGDTRAAGALAFVTGPGTPIRGPGSVNLTTTSDTADKATIENQSSNGAVADFEACYDWYRTGLTPAAVAPALKLGIDTPEDNPTGTTAEERGEDRFDKILVYEPYLNPLGRVLDLDTWVDECVTQTSGDWWLVDLTPGGAGVLISGPYQTLDEWLSDTTVTATSDVGTVLSHVDTEIVSLQLGVGSFNINADTNVGGIDYTTTSGSFSTNFGEDEWVPVEDNSTTTIVTSFAPATNTEPGVWFKFAVFGDGDASIADLTGVGGDLETAQPLPSGAARITTDFDNGDKAEVGVGDEFGTPDDILDTLELSYTYFKASNAGQNLTAAPSLKLTLFNPVCDDVASAGDCFGTLVYEPSWNGPTSTSTTPVSSSPPLDEWVTVDIDKDNGLFWWTGGFGEPSGAGGPPLKTLAEWQAAFSSDFDDALILVVSIGVGTFNQGQIGYFDDVRISHDSGDGFDQTYDFEPGGGSSTYTVDPISSTDDGVSYRVVVSNDCGGTDSASGLLTVYPLPEITDQPADQDACPGDDVTFSVTATGTGTLSYDWQCDDGSLGAPLVWDQGFASDVSGWLDNDDFAGFGQITHDTDTALVEGEGGTGGGPFSRFDGYRDTWDLDWIAEIDVYLDPAWADGEGFDYSVASNGSDGNHQRDFIFHVTKDTSTGDLIVGASNNTNFATREDLDTLTNNYVVTTAGWYTLQHHFYDDGGVLAVDMNLIDSSSTTLFTETRSDAGDTIPAEVGGNRYCWFTVVNVAGGLSVDNHQLFFGSDRFFSVGAPDDSSLLLTDVSFDDDGNLYRVIITDDNGCVSTSASATLSVFEPPTITLELVDAGDCPGEDVTFEVAATGTGTLTYEWTFDDGSGAVTLSETGTTLTVAAIDPSDGGTYEVLVTDDIACTTASTATLTVFSAPMITTQPSIAADPCVGDDLTISVVATGEGLTYSWEVSTDGGTSFTSTGETGDSITLTDVQLSDSGNQYQVVVFGTCSPVALSGAVELTVVDPAAVVTDPEDTTVCAGDPASFSVTASGEDVSYEWFVSTDGGTSYTPIAASDSDTLSLASVSAGDDGNLYRVEVTNYCGTVTSTSATLTVRVVPTVDVAPADQTECEGDDAVFSVTAGGSTPFTYEWFESTDGVVFDPIPSSDSPTLTVSAVDPSQDGNEYRVNIENDCGDVTSVSATLTVFVEPTISVEPVDTTACVGDSPTLSVVAAGPELTYEWSVSTDGGSTFSPIASSDSATLVISSVALTDDGNVYHVSVTNICGSVTSVDVTLTVYDVPTIDVQPIDHTVCEGVDVTFAVEASSPLPLTYQWQVDTGSGFADIGLATLDELELLAVTPAQSGNVYRCVVTNDCGSVESTGGTLTVLANPTIDVEPIDLETCLDGDVIFSVTASGEPPLVYEWQVDTGSGFVATGTDSNMLEVNDVTAGQDGDLYRVVITNDCSDVTSVTVTLTVNLPPTLTGPDDDATCNGEAATFSVVAAGNAPFEYDWEVDTGSGFSSLGAPDLPSLDTGTVTESDDGNLYRVVVTDANGCVTTSDAATLTVYGLPAVLGTDDAEECEGDTATFSVAAAGTGPFSYDWQVDTGSGFTTLGAADEDEYTTPTLTLSDDGNLYRCVVEDANGCETISDVGELTVLPAPDIDVQPVDAIACEGDDVEFSVEATGAAPLSYQWQVDTGSGFTNTGSDVDTLLLTSVSASQDGDDYRVIVSNDCGMVTSLTVSLTVNEPPVLTGPLDGEACEGDTVTFTVTATGSGPFEYDWQINTGTGFVSLGADDDPSYTTGAVDLTDDGDEYRCVVTDDNGCSTTSLDADLFVNPLPVLTTPEDQTACVGDMATFSVTATAGSAGFVFDWQVDDGSGFVSLGAPNDNDYTTPELEADDDGLLYRCVVTDGEGCEATSETAMLTVNDVPTIVDATFEIQADLFTVEFDATITSDIPYDVSWDFDDGDTSTDEDPTHEYDTGGSYTVTLTVSNDCGDVSVELIVVIGGRFERGDADGNGTIFPLLDALFILEWGFTNGPEPGCLDAADCDDNGVLFPLIDSIYLLDYGFNDGPLPPDPGPGDCGFDPTLDDLTCDTGTCVTT